MVRRGSSPLIQLRSKRKLLLYMFLVLSKLKTRCLLSLNLCIKINIQVIFQLDATLKRNTLKTIYGIIWSNYISLNSISSGNNSISTYLNITINKLWIVFYLKSIDKYIIFQQIKAVFTMEAPFPEIIKSSI